MIFLLMWRYMIMHALHCLGGLTSINFFVLRKNIFDLWIHFRLKLSTSVDKQGSSPKKTPTEFFQTPESI